MDTRRVGQAMRRRVGAPSAVYVEGHRTEDAKLLAQETERSVAQGNAGPNGSHMGGIVRHRGYDDTGRFGERTVIHKSQAVGTDYEAIEDHFEARGVKALAEPVQDGEMGAG